MKTAAVARDPHNGARLLIQPLDLDEAPRFEEQFTSRDYGEKEASLAANWVVETDGAAEVALAFAAAIRGRRRARTSRRDRKLLK